eukprot:TRINITY_DN7612_c0_g4_i1.p1 TRINITY_DN7612_c0_g4~~TRINITY_DN7612_c0_g4_i1.p1  ORF type:complete len:125 (+),score=1.43 TRINITY_DN7612_c0_g4_i1:99-473(+)
MYIRIARDAISTPCALLFISEFLHNTGSAPRWRCCLVQNVSARAWFPSPPQDQIQVLLKDVALRSHVQGHCVQQPHSLQGRPHCSSQRHSFDLLLLYPLRIMTSDMCPTAVSNMTTEILSLIHI